MGRKNREMENKMMKMGEKLKMMLVATFVAVNAAAVLPVAAVECPGGGTADTAAGCAAAGAGDINPDGADSGDLMTTIKAIINTVIYVVGIVAVVMVIIGGVQYATSQGDAGKVKKAKDTILYGIIGLVVVMVAFTVVNFVLSSVFSA